jgi:hypothetical protein
MPAAVRMPTAATFPASWTACPTGSPPLACAGACLGGAERFACGRAAVRRCAVAGFAAGAFFARAVVEARLSLRRPGRDRGRLPRTPGSSSRLAATGGKYRSDRRLGAWSQKKRAHSENLG